MGEDPDDDQRDADDGKNRPPSIESLAADVKELKSMNAQILRRLETMGKLRTETAEKGATDVYTSSSTSKAYYVV